MSQRYLKHGHQTTYYCPWQVIDKYCSYLPFCPHHLWWSVCACKITLVMSNSLQPHGLWLTRLLCPWDSPGKNTGVGCHALLREILPYPGIELMSLISPAWQADSVQLSHLGSPKIKLMWDYIFFFELIGIFQILTINMPLWLTGKHGIDVHRRQSPFPVHQKLSSHC